MSQDTSSGGFPAVSDRQISIEEVCDGAGCLRNGTREPVFTRAHPKRPPRLDNWHRVLRNREFCFDVYCGSRVWVQAQVIRSLKGNNDPTVLGVWNATLKSTFGRFFSTRDSNLRAKSSHFRWTYGRRRKFFISFWLIFGSIFLFVSISVFVGRNFRILCLWSFPENHFSRECLKVLQFPFFGRLVLYKFYKFGLISILLTLFCTF